MADQARVYWDSNCLLGWLKEEEDKKGLCEGTIAAAERGAIIICISALSFIEVIKLKGHSSLPREDEEKIVKFFDNPFFEIFDVDQWLGTYARRLIWERGVDFKDSIHVATAIFNNIPELNTFDEKLLALHDQLPLESGVANLRICKPRVPHPEPLFAGKGNGASEP